MSATSSAAGRTKWGQLKPSQWGQFRPSFPDHRARNRAFTTAHNPGNRSTLHAFGRLARSHARASARNARYRSRPPFRASSRHTVDAGRSTPRAIPLTDSPASHRIWICTRSTYESRNPEHPPRPRTNASSSRIRRTVRSETPNRAATSPTETPSRNRTATRPRTTTPTAGRARLPALQTIPAIKPSNQHKNTIVLR